MDGRRSLTKAGKGRKQGKEVSPLLGSKSDCAVLVNTPIINQVNTMASDQSDSDFVQEKDPGNANVNEKLDYLTKIMLGVAKDVSELKTSINFNDQQIKEVRDELSETKSDLADVTSELNQAKIDITYVKKENSDLKEKLVKIECQSRRDNLLIGGIPESRSEDCQLKVMKFFSDVLKVENSADIKITRCHRVPSGPYNQNRQKPRTMIVKFHWYADREKVWAKKNEVNQKSSEYWLAHDFPDVIKDRRKLLLPIAAEARRRGSEASVSVDRLIIDKRSYTVNTLSQLPPYLHPKNVATKTDGKVTAFYTEQSPLSNFFTAPHKDDNHICFHSSEQSFQMAKALHFQDHDTADKIKHAKTPQECFRLGKTVKGYDERVWLDTADDIMYTCVKMKFVQNPDLLQFLRDTGDTKLAEASRNKVWGTGVPMNSKDVFDQSQWDGQNRLGHILTRLRESIVE